MPDGTPIENDVENQREKDRKSEDDDYVSVIIKRTDETRRHPDDALHHAIEEGLEQINRPALALLLSAIAAGMIVGFSAMAVAVVLTALGEAGASESDSANRNRVRLPAWFCRLYSQRSPVVHRTHSDSLLSCP